MRVAVLGASGFVGTRLTSALRARGDEVVPASLRDPLAAAASAASCDAVVNLSGEPINQRWTAKAKARIEQSRTIAPRRFLDALAGYERKPSTFVSASAVGYYGTSETETFTETSPPGHDFLARVCIGWEREARRAAEIGMRVAIVRSGVALAADEGALKAMLPPFRLGVGGIVGTGRQWLSWVHVDDLVGIYLLALDRESGALNATAPNPATNAEFTRALANELGRPAILPVPTFVLRLMLGEGADMLLQGQRVLPERTQSVGFAFAFPELTGALANALH